MKNPNFILTSFFIFISFTIPVKSFGQTARNNEIKKPNFDIYFGRWLPLCRPQYTSHSVRKI